MQNESQTPVNVTNSQNAPSRSGVDRLLLEFVNWVNNNPVTTGISLNVRGTLISGELISGSEYFELLAADLEKGSANSIAEDIRTLGKYAYGQNENSQGGAPRQHIHLKMARFNIGNIWIPAEGGVLWRGRLDAVDGFILGAFHQTDDQDIADNLE